MTEPIYLYILGDCNVLQLCKQKASTNANYNICHEWNGMMI